MTMNNSTNFDLDIIGATEFVEIAGIKNIPAKVDTGADTSSIWASKINIEKDGTLNFVLFDNNSPLYTGEKLTSIDYTIKKVRSSHGDTQIRYSVPLELRIGNKILTTKFTLANRSRNNFPVLIGRRTINGNFLVDVSKDAVGYKKKISTSAKLNQEMRENPYEFHQKYFQKKEKGEL